MRFFEQLRHPRWYTNGFLVISILEVSERKPLAVGILFLLCGSGAAGLPLVVGKARVDCGVKAAEIGKCGRLAALGAVRCDTAHMCACV